MITDDDHRLHGTFIAESLSRDAVLTNLGITVDTITRACLDSPAPGQPDTWTLIAFEADAAAGDQLAATFAQSLNPGPWYVDFRGGDPAMMRAEPAQSISAAELVSPRINSTGAKSQSGDPPVQPRQFRAERHRTAMTDLLSNSYDIHLDIR